MNTLRARCLVVLSASFSIGLGSAIAVSAEPKPAASLPTEFSFAAHVAIDAPIVVGTGPQGLRRIVPITGGTFEGPRIKGTILNGGADWRHGPPEVIDRLAKGEAVDPSLYYFRTVAEFEAPSDSRYAWLNKALFIATAERRATVVDLRFYELK